MSRPGLADVGERLAPEQLQAAVERGRAFEMAEAILFARQCADEIAGPTSAVARLPEG